MIKAKNTSNRKRPQDAKAFTKRTFAWLRQIKADHKLPPSGALFALQLIEHFNRKQGGVGWASCKFIATAIGMSEATAINLFHLFERRGHLKVEWGKPGRGHSNRYWMIIKPEHAEVSATRKPQKKPQPAARKPQPVEENLSKNHLTVPAHEAGTEGRESARARAAPDGADLTAAPVEKNDAAKEKIIVPARNIDRFADLREIWNREYWQEDRLRDRRAFITACRKAEPDIIIEAAKLRVAAADAPRYLPPLWKWLDDDGWLKTPPQRRQRTNGHRRPNIQERFRAAACRDADATVLHW